MSLFLFDAGTEWTDAQRQALSIARELKAHGLVPCLVVPPGSALREKASLEGLAVLLLDLAKDLGFFATRRLARTLQKQHGVVAHFNDARSFDACDRAVARAQVPVRILARRGDAEGRAVRRDAKDIDAYVVPTPGIKELLVRGGLPDTAVEVAPAGIDFSAFEGVEPRDFLRREFGFAAGDFLIGAVAHLEDERGLHTLIEAAKFLRAHAPKSRVIILGEGSLRLDIDDHEAEPHVRGLVYYLGFRDDNPRILASLDLFVMSSHLDGLGGFLLEAMASRLPVVAAQAGSIPEIVIHRETGLLVPPRDAKALADAILKLYLDRNLAARLGSGGYDSVHQKYSAEAMARKVVAFYGRLASRKGVKLA